MAGHGIGTFLFFDDWMIDDCHDIERCYGRPKVQDPVIMGGEFGQPCTIERPGDQWPTEWRMWHVGRLDPDKITEPGRNPRGYLCMAESDDGVAWRKAKLPDGHRPVNDLPSAVHVHGSTPEVRWDPWDADPGRRYKVACRNFNLEPWANLSIGCSPDGVRWTVDDDPSHCWYHRAGGNDGSRTPLYNPVTGKWQVICRPYCPDRRIAMVESEDLQHWTEPITVMHPDGLDSPGTQFYGLRVWPYGVTNGCGTADDFEGYFVGLLNVYTAALGERRGGGKWTGNGHLEWAYSYNGVHWNRTNRMPIAGHEDPDVPFGLWMDGRPIGCDADGRFRMIVMGQASSHGGYPTEDGSSAPVGAYGDYGWRHATLRKDGFAYIRSNGQGRIGLKAMIPAAGDLNINFLSPHGRVRVQACNGNFEPREGYTFADCVPMRGDELHAPVRWKDRTADELIGTDVRLEFDLYDAHLYAVRWTCDHLCYADGPVYDLT